jgi:N-acetylneuraminic acid mutarotase
MVTQQTAALGIAVGYATAVTVGSKIYVLGGADAGTVRNECFVYDPVFDSISSIAPLPLARDSMAVAAIGTDIYAFGGGIFDPITFIAISTQTIFKYDTLANTWITLATTMPQKIQWAEALTFNGKIYVIGGGDFEVNGFALTQTTIANYNTVLEFTPTSPTTGSLASKSPVPISVKQPVGAVIGTKLYICSGDRTVGVHNNSALFCDISNQTFSYDPVADSWQTLAAFQTNINGQGIFGGRCSAGAATVNGLLYLMGGYTLPTPGLTTPPCPSSQGVVDGIARFTP